MCEATRQQSKPTVSTACLPSFFGSYRPSLCHVVRIEPDGEWALEFIIYNSNPFSAKRGARTTIGWLATCYTHDSWQSPCADKAGSVTLERCILCSLVFGISLSSTKPLAGSCFSFFQGTTALLLSRFRLYYFGYPLPNTYYAKVSHNRWYNLKEGFTYLLQFSTGFNLLVTMLFVVLTVALFQKRSDVQRMVKRQPVPFFSLELTFIFVVISCGLAIPFITGGDHFGSFRFYQGILPFFAWGLAAAWLLVYTARTQAQQILLVLITFGITAAIVAGRTLLNLKKVAHNELAFEFFLARYGRHKGDLLNRMWPDLKPTVGTIAVGGFGFVYKGTTIDLMGLNNVRMGHSPGERIGMKNHAAFSKAVFYELQPDLLLPTTLTPGEDATLHYAQLLSPNNFDNRALKLIFLDTAFQQTYEPIVIGQGAERLFAFCKKGQRPLLKRMTKQLIAPVQLAAGVSPSLRKTE